MEVQQKLAVDIPRGILDEDHPRIFFIVQDIPGTQILRIDLRRIVEEAGEAPHVAD